MRHANALQALIAKGIRLSKTNVATEMGIDRGTLNRYIADGLVPAPPWEKPH